MGVIRRILQAGDVSALYLVFSAFSAAFLCDLCGQEPFELNLVTFLALGHRI